MAEFVEFISNPQWIVARCRPCRNQHVREQMKKFPLKRKANLAVRSALRKGVLTKGPCEMCISGDEMVGGYRIVAHHCDYSKPLEVMWLCQGHHIQWHKQFKAKYPGETE